MYKYPFAKFARLGLDRVVALAPEAKHVAVGLEHFCRVVVNQVQTGGAKDVLSGLHEDVRLLEQRVLTDPRVLVLESLLMVARHKHCALGFKKPRKRLIPVDLVDVAETRVEEEETVQVRVKREKVARFEELVEVVGVVV